MNKLFKVLTLVFAFCLLVGCGNNSTNTVGDEAGNNNNSANKENGDNNDSSNEGNANNNQATEVQNQNLTCTLVEEDDEGLTSTQEMVATFKDDKLQIIEISLEMETESEEVASMSYDILKGSFESMEDEGIEFNASLDGKTIIIETIMDYTKISDEYLEENSDDTTPHKNATRKEVKEMIEDSGFTCE